MKTIRPLVLLASKRNICGQDRPIRFICCRENGQYSVNRGLNVHVRVHYDQEAAGGRQTCQVCRRCLLRGPSPSPPLSIHVQPSLHRKMDPSSFEIYSADVDYQSLFRANFTPRDIVWGDVDESCRLCLFAYDAIRAVCEGWSDLWSIVKECINLACKYSQQQI